MKRRFSVGVTVALAGACVLATATKGFSQTALTTVPVQVFPSGPVVPGASSTLVRTSSGVTGTFHTSGLQPGAAYSFWLVAFNYPDNCFGPCDLDDILPFPGNITAGVSMINIGGHVIGRNGRSDFGGHLSVGDTSAALFGPGLLEPFKAVIHLAVRAHGQPIPGMVDQQISAFNGGCPPNTCTNDQFAAHAPAADENSARLIRIEDEMKKVTHTLGLIGRRVGLLPSDLE